MVYCRLRWHLQLVFFMIAAELGAFYLGLL
jgi:hypothetical protein